ncbi:hypothetical protein FC789_07530 [Clostridium botulinum]|nr:hypothetical protein [Clostridium botulinum]
MFFVRIAFWTSFKASINNVNRDKVTLFRQDKIQCVAKKKMCGDKERIIIELGPFDNYEIAQVEGVNLLRNLKFQMCKKRIGIDISGQFGILDNEFPLSFFRECQFTLDGLEYWSKKLLKENKITTETIKEDILGLTIHEVNNNLEEYYFIQHGYDLRENDSLELTYTKVVWDAKISTCLSVLNSSELVNDRRLRFLLKIMTIEILVTDEEKKESEYISSIDKLLVEIDKLSIESNMKNKLKSDVGYLKNKSISQKCREVVNKFCSNTKYGDMDGDKLLRKCYSIRSSFVHAGTMCLDDIDNYSKMLHKLVVDILIGYQSEIKNKQS